MRHTAAITVDRPREEVQRLWHSADLRAGEVESANATVRFADARGDRGTEIHVELAPGRQDGKLRELVGTLAGSARPAKVKDELRRFKQRAETGEVPRSAAAPEGERAERKLKQRPAQPLAESEIHKVGA